jgi:hypothetical protein
MFSQRSASAQIETQKHHKQNTNIKIALIKSQTLIHRFVGALANQRGWTLSRLDVKFVFLIGSFKEEIFVIKMLCMV